MDKPVALSARPGDPHQKVSSWEIPRMWLGGEGGGEGTQQEFWDGGFGRLNQTLTLFKK